MSLDYGSYNDLVDEKKQALFDNVRLCLGEPALKVIELAFDVSNKAHYTQKRKSGEPYITHPTEVANIICDWGLDEETIASALLHDVIEDTEATKSDIDRMFGANIAELVDGVTKLEKIHFESEEIAHAEYFQKVVLAMSKDIRVILIKLADRLHNMLTLNSMSPEKRKRIALETMEIYVPIANKIGLHKVHLQLAEESFKQLYPLRYAVLSKAVDDAQKKRLPVVKEILTKIDQALHSNEIKANFSYRQRTIYNLYRRMVRRGQGFNRIHDIFEIKVIVDSIRDCYLTLGVLHSLYQPLPDKFKDYIAIPKSNGYQSLHSTLMGPHGTPIQLHIRTSGMEDIAENGIISHWLKHRKDDQFLEANQRTANWLNNILDIQSNSFSAHDFLTSLKQDLSPGDIYVFTPKGKIILLPSGSTALDFAYYIHSDVGNKCAGAKINQKTSKLDTKLQNGDVVEIVTDPNVEPSDEWLEIVVSGKAISRIKHYLKEQKYDEDVENGINLLKYVLKILNSKKTITASQLNQLTKKHYLRLSENELAHDVGNGSRPALEVIKKFLNLDNNEVLSIYLSKCDFAVIQDTYCLPLPGDKTIARITRHGELILHKQSCKQTNNLGLDNFTSVHIINDVDRHFSVKISALLVNEPGTFSKFASKISELGINILELNQEYNANEVAVVTTTLSVKNAAQTEELMQVLRKTNFIQQVNLASERR